MPKRKPPQKPPRKKPPKPPKPKRLKQKKGKLGEDLASTHLLKKGYQILEVNYRTPFGEIDIVCQDGSVMVFVEVKARTSLDQGLPEEAVSPQKLATITRVAEHFLQANNLEDRLARIDVVAVEFTTEPPFIRHLPDVTG